MRAAEPHHGIGRVREAKQAADDLQVGIQDGLRRKWKLAQPAGKRQKRRPRRLSREATEGANTTPEFESAHSPLPQLSSPISPTSYFAIGGSKFRAFQRGKGRFCNILKLNELMIWIAERRLAIRCIVPEEWIEM